MSSQPITIIGAGLAGLTLGRFLKHKGISAIVYERASSAAPFNYGMTLHLSTYQPLLNVLQIDDSTFREKLAVDALHSGQGNLSPLSSSDSFRCHRGRLELLLREGQTVKWDSSLKDVEIAPYTATATFQSGEQIESQCLVGCDGVHSQIRQCLAPIMKLKTLPYVVFNGKRFFSRAEYDGNIKPHMQDSVLIQTRKNGILLEIGISEETATTVNISYTYSRIAHDDHDILYNPRRAKAKATEISEEFYEELEQLEGLNAPFAQIFKPDKVRNDRVLHWLMRDVMPDASEAQRLADHGVILIGDAVHAAPILGGEGANFAIKDGIALADHIAKEGVRGIGSFSPSRYEMWKQAIMDSEERIAKMHGPTKPNL
ncbi:hypothetical protein MMC14_010089 [Varicellaria rhodocarpa]|nr:hypothetical protein [Varicellaria rhodocarpa]